MKLQNDLKPINAKTHIKTIRSFQIHFYTKTLITMIHIRTHIIRNKRMELKVQTHKMTQKMTNTDT